MDIILDVVDSDCYTERWDSESVTGDNICHSLVFSYRVRVLCRHNRCINGGLNDGRNNNKSN